MQNDQDQLTLVAGVLAKLRRRITGWNCMVLKYFRWMRAVRRSCRVSVTAKNAIVTSGKMREMGGGTRDYGGVAYADSRGQRSLVLVSRATNNHKAGNLPSVHISYTEPKSQLYTQARGKSQQLVYAPH